MKYIILFDVLAASTTRMNGRCCMYMCFERAVSILHIADNMREILDLSSSSIVAMTNGIHFEYSSSALWSASVSVSVSVSLSASVSVSLSVCFSVCLFYTLSAGLCRLFTFILFCMQLIAEFVSFVDK